MYRKNENGRVLSKIHPEDVDRLELSFRLVLGTPCQAQDPERRGALGSFLYVFSVLLRSTDGLSQYDAPCKVKAAATPQHFDFISSREENKISRLLLSIGHHRHASTIIESPGIRPGTAYDIIAINYVIFPSIAAVSKCFDSRNAL